MRFAVFKVLLLWVLLTIAHAADHSIYLDHTNQIININTATQTELIRIKGVGPTKAQAIIQYRQQHGPFKTLDDLQQVNGIGPKTIANNRDILATNF